MKQKEIKAFQNAPRDDVKLAGGGLLKFARPLHFALLGSFALAGAALIAPATTKGQTPAPPNFVDSINGDGVSRTLTTDGFFRPDQSLLQATRNQWQNVRHLSPGQSGHDADAGLRHAGFYRNAGPWTRFSRRWTAQIRPQRICPRWRRG